MTDLNEKTLEEVILKIKAHGGKPVRLKPTQVIVPGAVLQQVAAEQGCTLEQAREFVRIAAEHLTRVPPRD